MKSKLCIDYSGEENLYPAKMIKKETVFKQVSRFNNGIDSRNLPFKLTDKTAKKNLINGAKRIPFEKDFKQKCVKLKFSSGAYKEVVMPKLVFWKSHFNQKIRFNNFEIKVAEAKAGFEENSKHFDTKIVFNTNNSRIVIHSYNST